MVHGIENPEYMGIESRVHGFVLVGSPPAIGIREIANSLVVNPLHREFPSAEPRNPEVLYHVSHRSINGPD